MKTEKELLAENNLGLIYHVIKMYGLNDKFEDYFDNNLEITEAEKIIIDKINELIDILKELKNNEFMDTFTR